MILADRYLMLSKPFDSHHNNISSSNENEQCAQNWVTLLSYLHTQPTCFLALFFSPPCAPNRQHVLILDEASMIDGMLFEALDDFGREVNVPRGPSGESDWFSAATTSNPRRCRSIGAVSVRLVGTCWKSVASRGRRCPYCIYYTLPILHNNTNKEKQNNEQKGFRPQ
jgi:hypothetical protein